jgi:hypothetical protein
MGFVAVTQTNSSSTNTGAAPRNSSSIVPQFQLAKVLLEDAIQSLQNNDTNRALIRLNLADQQISSSVAENLSSAQIIKVLLEDAIQSLQNNDTNRALIRLNLADQQISSSVAENLSSAQIIKVLLEDAIQSLQNNDTNKARASKLG